MHHHPIRGAVTALALLCTALPLQAAEPEVLVTIDNLPITRDLFMAYFEQRTDGKPGVNPAQYQVQLLNELVNFVLLRQESERQQLAGRADVKAGLRLAQDQYLSNVVIAHMMEQEPITEEEVKSRYEKEIAGQSKPEYKAHHILVETEEKAREVLVALGGGGDFAAIAKERSIDSSADHGGELDWMQTGDLPAEFEQALAALQPGERGKEPVKTEFGWHVVQLDQRREPPKPPYEKVRPQLIQAIQKERVSAYLNELRSKAEIKTVAQQAARPKP